MTAVGDQLQMFFSSVKVTDQRHVLELLHFWININFTRALQLARLKIRRDKKKEEIGIKFYIFSFVEKEKPEEEDT